jgi:predicted nucleic acid-binding protein
MSEAAVVDASVALAWVLPAEGTEQALRLREEAVARPAFALLAPSLFWYEVGNVLWRAARQGRMAEDAAMSALDALERFAIETRHVRAAACLELALAQRVSVYEASYIALALDAGCSLWTLDRGLATVARARGLMVAP